MCAVAFVGMFGFSFERLHPTHLLTLSQPQVLRQVGRKDKKWRRPRTKSFRLFNAMAFWFDFSPAAMAAIVVTAALSVVSSLRNWKVLRHLSSPGKGFVHGQWLCEVSSNQVSCGKSCPLRPRDYFGWMAGVLSYTEVPLYCSDGWCPNQMKSCLASRYSWY